MAPRGLFLVFAVLAAVLGGAGVASAHASLVTTAPVDGAHAETAPAELVLQLNEPVTVVDGSAQLIDGAGTRFTLAGVRVDDGQRRLVLVPAEPVPDGAYLATARVVSADTHVVSLSIRFTVGAVTEQGEFAAPAGGAGIERFLNSPGRWLTYLGLVLSAGLFLAARLAWPDVLRSRRFAVVYRVGGAVLAAGLLLRFAVLVAQQSGGLGAVSLAGARVLLGTPHGLALTAAVLLALVAVAAPRPPVVVTQAVTAILAVTLGGHGGSVRSWPWSFLGTLLHVYAISVWLGGVAVLILVRPRTVPGQQSDAGPAPQPRVVARWLRRSPAGARREGNPDLRRWHRVAAWHVLAVVLGGLLLALIQVRPAGALLDTRYGLVLLGKIGLVAVAVAFGYLAYCHLRRAVLIEAVVAVAILAATSILTTLPPAKDTYTTDITATLDFGATEVVRIGIDSIRRGPQQLTLAYTPPAPGPEPSVSVDLSSAAANVARLPVTLTAAVAGDGSLLWRSDKLIVPAPGEWKVTVRFDAGAGPKLASFRYRAL
ncbi:copper resistance protein CopC [Nocardia sp. NPDC050697]|uniref:copper resistance CopC/CopD family protein n=1 Tax=Nocardia sp. NPDC050697 TaxID=3155158 RepID=UPI0033DFE628